MCDGSSVDVDLRPSIAGTLLLSVAAFLIGAAVVAEAVQQPEPDAAFTRGVYAENHGAFCSVFADALPSLESGQILLQRHLYTAAIDPEKRQPVWIAYTVQRSSWDTDNVLSRNFHTPKHLQDVALEQSDYAGSGYELGHLYGLQFVSREAHAAEVNEVEVIAAQRPDLNKGPWLAAENRIKRSSETQTVQVMAGQLWHDPMPPLANADESHSVASHCWIIFSPGPDGSEEAYKIPQSVARSDALEQFAVSADALREEVSSRWECGIRNGGDE